MKALVPEGRSLLQWAPFTPSSNDPNALFVATCEVARLSQRLDGSWFATLTIPGQTPRHRNCSSYETGKAGCHAWAVRHMNAILRGAEQTRLEALARRAIR